PAPLGDAVPSGKMLTTGTLITDPQMLAELRAEGVVSLDMETAAIAAVCGRRGIPWAVVRVISDRASNGTVNEEVFRLSNQDGTPNEAAIAVFIERYPELIPQLAQMGKDAELATETAADEAIRITS
ncbi:MAG TPA: hypothetical protein VGI06_08355, partial [Acidimicrobiales bacterium]